MCYRLSLKFAPLFFFTILLSLQIPEKISFSPFNVRMPARDKWSTQDDMDDVCKSSDELRSSYNFP